METEIEEVVVAPKAPKLTSKELYDQSEALSQPDPKEVAINSLKSEEPQDTGGSETESGNPLFANPTFEPDPKNEQIYALEAEVNEAAGGKPIASIVWQAKKKDGTTGGVSLKFYYDCKLKEIFNESDCPYDSLVSAPVSTLKPSATVAPVGAAKMKTKKCSNCN